VKTIYPYSRKRGSEGCVDAIASPAEYYARERVEERREAVVD